MSDQFSNGYALLIGVNESYVAGWALPDVAGDITALARVLTHPQRCAYPQDNIRLVMSKEATRAGIMEGLKWLKERLQARTSAGATPVVYYTGHGWRDKDASPADFCLIPYDIQADMIKFSALPAAAFAEAVGNLKPERLLAVLDCCHAAGMNVKEGPSLPEGYAEASMAPALLMKGEKAAAGPGAKGLEMLAGGHGRAVLSSSTGDQRSYIRQDGRMSIFTYHLIEALTGHAQPKEGATQVLVSDVMGHVTRKVPASVQAAYGQRQEPDFQVSGNFPIALLLGGKGLSNGQPAPDPLDQVSDQPGVPGTSYHAEVHGPGAIAQGPGAVAASGGSVAVGGDVKGSTITTGDRNVPDTRGDDR